MLLRSARKAAKPILVRMTKPQLHRHLTTGIFNQLSKILKKLRLSDFFLDRAAGKFQQVLELCAPEMRFSAFFPVFCATKPDYQFLVTSVNFTRIFFSAALSKIRMQDSPLSAVHFSRGISPQTCPREHPDRWNSSLGYLWE